jgi:hypothetical protein
MKRLLITALLAMLTVSSFVFAEDATFTLTEVRAIMGAARQ